MCIHGKLYRDKQWVLPASCHVRMPSSLAIAGGRVERGRGGTWGMDVQESPTFWILPGQQKHVSSVGSFRAPGMRCSRWKGKLGKEGESRREASQENSESLRASQPEGESQREAALNSCSREREELAGLSGAQGAGRIGCPPIFAEPSAVCNLSPHLLPSFITKKGQRVCADPNNEGVQKCKSELRLGSAVEDLRSLLVERKRLDRAPSSPSLLPHRPHWRAVAWITF